MSFTPDFLHKLKDLIEVSAVVSRKVKLQKHGKDFFGRCPFHTEKTGSFSVNDEKKFYHCFGCGAHGDIFKFVQDSENISFNEAVQSLAKSYNISVPKWENDKQKVSEVPAINSKALAFFQEMLFSTRGEKALEYLIERGISRKLIDEFSIGYAPAKGLIKHLIDCGYSQKQIEHAGLTKVFSNGDLVDKFRDRVIFPISSRFGDVIAFGGRAISKDAKPKYLNSPETEIFKKNYILYLENKIFKKRHLSEVFIVEGYTDAIAMSKVGIDNVVATLGTAISEHHILKLWKIVKEPTVLMDGDAAGIKATERAIEIALPLLRPGYSINFVSLKAGYDPDDMVTEFGEDQLKQFLQQKTSLSEMIWKISLSRADFQTPEQQALFKKDLYALVDRISDANVKDMYKKYFSKKIFELFSYKKNKTSAYGNTTEPVLKKNKLTLLQRLEMTIAAIILENIVILRNDDVYENFISIEPKIEALDNMYREILEVFGECNSDICEDNLLIEEFRDKIKLVVKYQLYDYLCGVQSYFVDKMVVNDYNQAVALFNNTFDLYKLELLKEDYIKSIKRLDEASLEKAKLLREQIKIQERLLKERMN